MPTQAVKKYEDKTGVFVECAYWSCKAHTILFTEETGLGANLHTCAATNKSLNFWQGSRNGLDAPNFCPKRI